MCAHTSAGRQQALLTLKRQGDGYLSKLQRRRPYATSTAL